MQYVIIVYIYVYVFVNPSLFMAFFKKNLFAVWTFRQIALTLWVQDRKSTFKLRLQQCKFFCQLFDLAASPPPSPTVGTPVSKVQSLNRPEETRRVLYSGREPERLQREADGCQRYQIRSHGENSAHYGLFGIMIPLSSSCSDKKYNCSSDSHKGMYKINM